MLQRGDIAQRELFLNSMLLQRQQWVFKGSALSVLGKMPGSVLHGGNVLKCYKLGFKKMLIVDKFSLS